MAEYVEPGFHGRLPQVKGQVRLRSVARAPYLGSVRFFKHLIIGFILFMMTVPWVVTLIVYQSGARRLALAEAGLAAAEQADPGPDAAEYDALLGRVAEYEASERQLLERLEQLERENLLYGFTSAYASLYPDLRVEPPAAYEDSDKVVYLTFDDGPGTNTRAILNILERYDIKATFFVVGYAAIGREDLLRQIAEEGHNIGVHTHSHVYKDIYNSLEAFMTDFYYCSTLIEEVTGIKPNIFRFPGGSINSYNESWGNTVISEMLSRGYRYYDWNCGSSDVAADATTASIYEAVLRQVHSNPYSVVLMHDGGGSQARTVEALPLLIEQLRREGYTFGQLTNRVKPTVFTSGSYGRG